MWGIIFSSVSGDVIIFWSNSEFERRCYILSRKQGSKLISFLFVSNRFL